MNTVTEIDLISNGTLMYHDEEVPIKATYASHYSLYINFMGESKFTEDVYLEQSKPQSPEQQERRFNYITDTVFDNLTLNLDGAVFEFGKCRFVSDHDNPQFSGKLFFIDDVYDIFEIFSSHRVISLEDHFKNVAIIFPQKDKVLPEFKEYTSNLTYDMKVYKGLFNEMDLKYRNEDPLISAVIQNAIIKKEGNAFNDFFDTKLQELAEIVSPFTEKEHATHAYFFRKQLWDMIITSEFLRRTNIKPRGYAGDSRMMTMIYDNTYRGRTTFAKLMHKHPINIPAAQAVRNRIKILGNIINEISNENGNGDKPFKVLSLACGPAREIEYIINSPEQCKKFEISLFDQDVKAIDEARSNIASVEHRLNERINYNIIKNSIRTILSVADLSEKWGKFNFIYALGLFDYLTDRVAKAIIPKLHNLLLPGGQILIGNYHHKNPNKYYMDYWMDWSLYYREEEDMLNLADTVPSVKKDVFFDDSHCQMFLRITRE